MNKIDILKVSIAFFCLLIPSYLQEKIVKSSIGTIKWDSPISLICIQFTFQWLLAHSVNIYHLKKDKKSRPTIFTIFCSRKLQLLYFNAPMTFFLSVSLSTSAAMYCTNASLKSVDYPTQVLVKSCKMLSVMFFQFFILKKRFKFSECISVIVLSFGIMIFSLGRIGDNGNQSTLLGILLLIFSLTFDGITASIQEHMKQKYRPTSYQFMEAMNVISMIMSLPLILMSESNNTMLLVRKVPNLMTYLILYGIASAISQAIIFHIVTSYGSLTTSIVTNLRKFFTIFLSIIIFRHKLTMMSFMGIIVVFVGIGLNVKEYENKRKRMLK